jgi:hypothetical protein
MSVYQYRVRSARCSCGPWAVFGRPFYPMLESPVASRHGIDPSQENGSKHASDVALYDFAES